MRAIDASTMAEEAVYDAYRAETAARSIQMEEVWRVGPPSLKTAQCLNGGLGSKEVSSSAARADQYSSVFSHKLGRSPACGPPDSSAGGFADISFFDRLRGKELS
jgi:hypothetical protein